MKLRLLAGGVDSLYLSAQGGVQQEVWGALEAVKVRAQHEREAVPVEFERAGWRLLLKPHGFRGYPYWLTSPDVEVWLGRREAGPVVRFQLHAVFLHTAGPEAALSAVEGLLSAELFTWPPSLTVSRLDVYADVQGWQPVPADMGRFASRANHRELHMVGRDFTGFVFGKSGGVQARLYEKTAQMREAGLSWMRARWRGYDESGAVWRLEFELRGPLLRRLESREPRDVLASVPGLWRYCTKEWLTLRKPTANAQATRWPVDPVWATVQGLSVVEGGDELVWREVEEASEERVLAILQGSLTSWAAMWGLDDPVRAARAMVLRVGRYLARRDRTFATEVRRKQARVEARGVRRAVLSRRAQLRPVMQAVPVTSRKHELVNLPLWAVRPGHRAGGPEREMSR